MIKPKWPADIQQFLEELPAERAPEVEQLLALMHNVTGESPKLWRGGMIGFGTYHYKYDSGREGEWFLTGFGVRKDTLSIYITSGFDMHKAVMESLGKYKTGKSCLYVKGLRDIDLTQLETLIENSVKHMKGIHSAQ